MSESSGSIVRVVGYVNLEESVSPSVPRGRESTTPDENERLLFVGRRKVEMSIAPGSVFGKVSLSFVVDEMSRVGSISDREFLVTDAVWVSHLVDMVK